jgi:Domain of unknown function (DUF1816)
MNISEIGANLLNFLGQAWWIEINTVQPKCTYYFGPFIDQHDAIGRSLVLSKIWRVNLLREFKPMSNAASQ